MNKKNMTIKTMTPQELKIAVEWAAQEGWNPGLYDADCYFKADSTGFLMGYLGEEPVASISVVRYGPGFGFLGFYIVKPEYRGQGYGIQIWNAGLKYLKGCNIGLDGVVDQQQNYQKAGFKLAYRNIRFQGKGGGEPPEDYQIADLSSVSFDTLLDHEQPFFPEARPQFLECWVNQPESHFLAILDKNKLVGYGMARRCCNGYKIGPLHADSTEFAEQLFIALKSKVPEGTDVFLDVPEVNDQALNLVRKYNMNLSFETARMYTGEFPELPLKRIFGVTSFEIG